MLTLFEPWAFSVSGNHVYVKKENFSYARDKLKSKFPEAVVFIDASN